MPIYEYECLECAHRFDEIQRFSDPPKDTCPKCSAKVRKLIFPAAVIFKGSGFYATEYGKSKHSHPSSSESKSESSSSEAKSDSKTDSKTDSKSETKSESKSETKSESKSESKSEAKSETKPASSDKPAS